MSEPSQNPEGMGGPSGEHRLVFGGLACAAFVMTAIISAANKNGDPTSVAAHIEDISRLGAFTSFLVAITGIPTRRSH